MTDEIEAAYDSMAPYYQQIYGNWPKAVKLQGLTLAAILRDARKLPGTEVLDCSCGIGTQAIGLALLDYHVLATDLSAASVLQARKNARALSAKLRFGVAGIRNLARDVSGQFDAVLSCDNSIPHLLTHKDLLLAARNIRSKTKPGGVFVMSMRDYDALQGRPTGTLPMTINSGGAPRVYVQTWTWERTRPIYRFNLFVMNGARKGWTVNSVSARYRAWKRSEMTAAFIKAGFSKVCWMMPRQSGYHQPVAIFK